MRRYPIIFISGGLVFLLVAAGSVYAYDSSRKDTIAKGIKVGQIDVGGLSPDAARARLRERMLDRLQDPLVVVAGETEFPLSAREAHIKADIDAMVASAVQRGREGSIVQRTWRGLTGGEVPASVTPKVDYSHEAVRRLVDKVRVKMTRKPVEADISVAGDRSCRTSTPTAGCA
jgi:hypothetical protein